MELNMAFGALVALGMGIIVSATILFKNREAEAIFTVVKALVDEAEKKFGSGTGELKYNHVVRGIYGFMPGYARLFVSEKLLDLWIETAVDELQETLDKKIKEAQ